MTANSHAHAGHVDTTATTGDAHAHASSKGDRKKEKDMTAAAAAKTKDVTPANKPAEATYQFADKAPPDGPFPIKKIVFPENEGRAAPGVLDKGFLDSIESDGILQSVSCVPLADGTGLLFAGRRRVRAASQLKMTEVPVHWRVVKKSDLLPGETVEQLLEGLAISENINRQQANAWDQYVSFSRMIEHGATQTQIAKRIGRSDGYVSQHLNLGKLADKTKAIIKKNATETTILSKARELMKLNAHPEVQSDLAEQCFDPQQPWTFTELQERVTTTLLKIDEKEKKAAEREKQKKQAERKAAGEGEGDDVGSASEEEEEEDKFASVELAPIGKKIARNFLSYLDSYLNKAKLMPEETAEQKQKKAERVAYEKGRMEVAQQFAGIKELPKSLRVEE